MRALLLLLLGGLLPGCLHSTSPVVVGVYQSQSGGLIVEKCRLHEQYFTALMVATECQREPIGPVPQKMADEQ